jgi:flagellar hook-associated protein 3
MRITANQVVKNLQSLIDDRYSDMSGLEEQLATGKRILKPSDHPADIANDLNDTTTISELAQYKTNLDDSLSYMNVTDTAMSSMNDTMQRLRELAVSASSDTINTSERIAYNQEVEQLFRSLITVVNTQYKGDYIFGGTETKIPPLELKSSRGDTTDDYAKLNMAYFNAAGQTVPAAGIQLFNAFDNTPITNIIPGTFVLKNGGATYVEGTDYTMDYQKGTMTIINPALAVDTTPGTPNYAAGQFDISFDYVTKGKDIYGDTVSNQGGIYREIEKGVTTQINISADEFMNDPVTGSNMVGTLINYGQDLLNNNTTGVGNDIGSLDSLYNAILAAQGKNGARENNIQSTVTRNADQSTYSKDQQSTLEDVDMATAATDFANMQNVYNAALKSGASVIQESLVNFL